MLWPRLPRNVFLRPPEPSYELSNEIVIGRAAHHFCVRIGGRLRRDALHAGHVRSDGRGTDRSPRCPVQEGIRAARGGNRSAGEEHPWSQPNSANGDGPGPPPCRLVSLGGGSYPPCKVRCTTCTRL